MGQLRQPLPPPLNALAHPQDLNVRHKCNVTRWVVCHSYQWDAPLHLHGVNLPCLSPWCRTPVCHNLDVCHKCQLAVWCKEPVVCHRCQLDAVQCQLVVDSKYLWWCHRCQLQCLWCHNLHVNHDQDVTPCLHQQDVLLQLHVCLNSLLDVNKCQWAAHNTLSKLQLKLVDLVNECALKLAKRKSVANALPRNTINCYETFWGKNLF